MKTTSCIFACCLNLFLLAQAHAEPGNFSVGAKAGTLGLGAEADLCLTERLSVRGGVNLLSFSFDATISDLDYEMDPEFKNLSVILDWYPFDAGFRLSGGLFLNDSGVDVTGTARTDSELANSIPAEYAFVKSYADRVNINGSADYNTIAPYVGLGWNSNHEHEENSWGVSFDLGVLFMGSPSVSKFTISSGTILDAYQDLDEIQEELEKQRQDVEEELEEFQFYPVASLMVHYTF